MATGSEPSKQPPQVVGPWALTERLGQGGNAVVYKATRDGIDYVALKVIKTQKADREPYKRFAREVNFLSGLTIEDGVLPLIEANIPDEPAKDNPAWLAMPIAQPIRLALAEESLETIVDAVATIADTLARLAARGIAHRDIKPGNLYCLDGRWLVGDFGLIDIPDLEQLTLQGRPLGPAHFTAHELIVSPESADARRADVYSLGKTLWVLATEERYPPEGHQAKENTGFGISDMRPHPHAAQLDSLIDSMTQLRPELRPTMNQVARDLRGWLRMTTEQPGLNIDDIRARVRARLQPELDELDVQGHRTQQAEAARTRILHLIDPLNLELKGIHPKADIDRRYDEECGGLLRSQPTLDRVPSVYNWYTVSWIETGPGPQPLQLKFGYGIELDTEGNITVRAVIICGYKGIMGDNFFWLSNDRTAPVGSIEAEQDMQSAAEDLFLQFPAALEFFHGHLPGARQP